MKTGSPSVPSSRRRDQLRARKLTIDKFAAWQKSLLAGRGHTPSASGGASPGSRRARSAAGC